MSTVTFTKLARFILCIVLLSIPGCSSLKGFSRTTLTQEEAVAVVARARTLALESGLVRKSERTTVETGAPKLAYYFTAGRRYARYSVAWQFSGAEGVSVFGQGDILSLVGAEVKRLP
jgi:hypothetical protein